MTNTTPVAPPTAKVFTPPQDGDVVNVGPRMYIMGQPLGTGAFGSVCECTDMWGNELVAKVMVPQGQDYATVKQNWAKEAENMLAVRHPNVTSIIDAFEWRDTFYIIMERCHSSLEDLLNIPYFNPQDWVGPFCQGILQAVEYIHISGMVHKDLHSKNIFIQFVKDSIAPGANQPVAKFKIGDLGIANIAGNIRGVGTIMANWMLPPEMLDSQFGPVDHHVDLYHIGLLLLRFFAGPLPVYSNQQILDGEPRKLAETLPQPYATAISKALRRRVAYRSHAAVEIWNDLGRPIPT